VRSSIEFPVFVAPMISGLRAFVACADFALAAQRMKGIDVVVAEAAPVAYRSSLYFGPILIAVVSAHVSKFLGYCLRLNAGCARYVST
jgi:hypothetical protein